MPVHKLIKNTKITFQISFEIVTYFKIISIGIKALDDDIFRVTLNYD